MLKLKKENKKKMLATLLVIVLASYFVKNKIKLVTEVTSLIFSPIQSKIYTTSENMEIMTKNILNYGALVDEIKEKKDKIALLESEIYSYKNLKEENEHLKQLLEFKKENKKYRVAEITFRHIYEIYERFTVNLGEKDGIQRGMVAVLGGNLVGKIELTQEDFSVIRTINSETLPVSVKDSKGNLGIVKGDEEEPKNLVYIPSIYNEEIIIGDMVYTSGISDIYPKGLIVGAITSKGKEDGEFLVTPAIDVSKLTEVIIIERGVK